MAVKIRMRMDGNSLVDPDPGLPLSLCMVESNGKWVRKSGKSHGPA